jgi:hypothetical protein
MFSESRPIDIVAQYAKVYDSTRSSTCEVPTKSVCMAAAGHASCPTASHVTYEVCEGMSCK